MFTPTRAWICLSSIVLVTLLHQHLLAFIPLNGLRLPDDPELRKDIEIGDLVWDQIVSSTELKWTPCYKTIQCARLQVPLNYSDPEGRPASIALARVPSPYTGTKDYRGPVLFNPGGPGGSGVELVAAAGSALSTLIGPQFDVVSFDPRGVGFSSPRASFFDTEAERTLWGSTFQPLNATADGVARNWARAQIMGRLAEEHDDGSFIHINTENTARDMLKIVEAHGRDKIQYWGFSYGTVLGATFASIFPDRIERLVLDGVVDSPNYFATLWSNNLRDTDKTLHSFFTSCAEAGPDSCAFYEPTPEAIEQKLNDLTNSIYLRPVPVQTELTYGLLDYTRLRFSIFQALYAPYVTYPILANGLADLAEGDGTLLYRMLEQPMFDCSCGLPHVPLPVVDGQTTILCTDGEEIRDTVEELQEYVDDLLATSQWGEIWANIHIGCTAWPKQVKNHFRGPFVGNTSHPILWVGNTADPVTPVSSAHKMAKGFPGSVVLTQDSPGHCSLSAPSVCTQKYIREYLINGTLPEEGVVCDAKFPIFSKASAQVEGSQSPQSTGGFTAEERSILNGLDELRNKFRIPTPFFL